MKGCVCRSGKSISVAVGVMLLLASAAGDSLAGALSGPGYDALGVSNPSNELSQPGAAEQGWLSGLHISGYGSQTFGMWQNPAALSDFTPSRNNLAVSRTLLQVDENYRLNENNTFFMREWFVYEPPYSFDSANIKHYGLGINPALQGIIPNRAAPSYGHFMNDWN